MQKEEKKKHVKNKFTNIFYNAKFLNNLLNMWSVSQAHSIPSTRCRNFINAGQSQTIKSNTRFDRPACHGVQRILLVWTLPVFHRFAAHYHLLDKIDGSALEQWSDVSRVWFTYKFSRCPRIVECLLNFTVNLGSTLSLSSFENLIVSISYVYAII